MSERHLFTDGVDTVIAVDVEEANRVWGETVNDDHFCVTEQPWQMIPDDDLYTVMFEDWHGHIESGDTVIPPNALVERNGEFMRDFTCAVTATAGDWATANKPHILCSTEW